MDKRKFFIQNASSDNVRIVELKLSLPPGIHNLFDLNSNIDYEQIDHSIKIGTLSAAIENGICSLISEQAINKSLSEDIIVRRLSQIQIIPPRVRFSVISDVNNSVVFDPEEDAELFGERDPKPARQLEEEIKKTAESLQSIEATIKQTELPEQIIQSKVVCTPTTDVVPYPYAPMTEQEKQDKIKIDLKKGYKTCEGITLDGKRCIRMAKKRKNYCGLHKKQDPKY